MKFLTKNIFFLLIIFTLTTCKNKLNINAPYKEIPSIYAVLNPQDNIQIIRINKVFLGEGDANVMAKVADSVNYNADDLSIILQRYKNGVLDSACKNSASKTLTFHDSIITTNSGAFSTTQRVYVCADKLFNTGEYHLTVKNVKTNALFTAKSLAVDTIHADISTTVNGPYYPVTAQCPGYPTCAPNYYINYTSQNNSKLSFSYKIRDGKINQVKMRLHFYDSLFAPTVDYPNQKQYRYIDYPFSNQLSKNASQGNSNSNFNNRLQLDFRSTELFTAFGLELAKMGLSNSITGRRVYKIEYFIYSSTQEYADYLDYTTPSLRLAQQKPLYSNFDNNAAIGIFTFRSTKAFSKETDNAFENDFATNPNTCSYKFYVYNSPSWGLPGCQ